MNPNVPDIYAGAEMVRLALCQVRTAEWDSEGNLRRTLESLEAAADRGAQLAVTPECVLHGYGTDVSQRETRQRLEGVAQRVDGPCLQAVRDLAARRSMAIVIGFAEKGEGGLLHNSAAVITRRGEVADVYRKVHCRHFENVGMDGNFTPGERFVVVDMVCGGVAFRLGVMICFDREIPESVRCLRAMGAELIACPLACQTRSIEKPENFVHNEVVTRCRAAENEVFIAVVNHAGRFNGGSFVVGPGGEALCQMGDEGGVEIVQVPAGMVSRKLHNRPLSWMGWGYRRPEVYRRALE